MRQHETGVSRERAEYLSRRRRRKRRVLGCQIGILAAFFLLWEGLARVGIIDSFILSQPTRILETLLNLSLIHI